MLLLLTTACTDEPGPKAVPTTAVPTTAPTTVSPSVAPTAGPSLIRPTPGATRGPAKDGDVDGDGREDTVTATQELLTVVLSSGRTLTAPVVADVDPPVQGVVDVDRDGRAEVFLETTRGASTVFYTPFRYDGTRLQAVQLEGEPVRLGVGGSVTHGDGFACAQGRLVTASSTSTDGERFDVTTTTYRVLGFTLQQVARTTATGLPQGDRRVGASYEVSCGSVTQDG